MISKKIRKAFPIFILIFSLYFCLLASAEEHSLIWPKEAVSRFYSAENAYKKGDYALAVKEYEGIVNGGLASGNLYYNLGNCYFKIGQIGKSILNYERALRITPRDQDIKFNRNFAALQAGLPQENSGSFLRKALQSHAEFYSVKEMALILTSIFMLIGILHILSLYMSWRKTTIRAILGILVFIFILYTVGLSYKVYSEQRTAIVIFQSEAKFEPRQEAVTYFNMAEGLKVRILKKETGWVKIQLFDDKQGWIPEKNIEGI